MSLASWFLGTGHLAFITNSNISKGWRIIADERIVGRSGIIDRLANFADCWGSGAFSLLK